MKKLNLFLLLITTMSVLTFSSCSSSDDGGDGGDAPSGLLTADVSGKSFKSFEQSSSATIATNGQTKNLVIITTSLDAQGISMNIFGYEGPDKTYDIKVFQAGITNVATYSETKVNLSNPMASTTELWQAPFGDAKAGSVSISEETDTHIIGTFEFKGKNVGGDGSIKDIKGAFNLKKKTI
jgi:hypothetical protein